MPRPTPYVGITGFTQESEIKEVVECVPMDTNRWLMVGLLANSKTLIVLQDRYPNRHPPIERLPSLCLDDPRLFNVVHFYSEDKRNLVEEIAKILDIFARADNLNLHGIQLNNSWIAQDTLFELKGNYPELKIIMPITRGMLDKMNYEPSMVKDYVLGRRDLIDYCLIDPSEGAGRTFNPAHMASIFEELYESFHLSDIGFGFAGGLSASNAYRIIRPLALRYSRLSCDAESALRSPPPEDKLSTSMAEIYVQEAFAANVAVTPA